MRDIGEILRAELANHEGAQPPPFDGLFNQARRRRTRATGVVVAGVVAAGAGIGAAVAALPSDQPTTSPSTTASPAETGASFDVPTSTWQAGDPQLEALTRGVLAFSERGCPYLESNNGQRVLLVFPAKAHGVVDTDGMRAVVSADGRLYGIEGAHVSYTGGALPNAAVSSPCADMTGVYGTFSIHEEPRQQ